MQRFMNFGNVPTFHFFCWVRSGGLGPPAELVNEAMNGVDKDPWFEMGLDTSLIARNRLEEILEQRLDADNYCGAEDWAYLDRFCEDVPSELEDGLHGPLLAWALEQIDYSAVAVALLVEAGKWFPDKFPEEKFPLPDDVDAKQPPPEL